MVILPVNHQSLDMACTDHSNRCDSTPAFAVGGTSAYKVSTVNLFSRAPRPGDKVICHYQAIEDRASTKAKSAHHLSDGLSGFLEGPEHSDLEAGQARDVFRAEAGSDTATILIVVPVDKVMNAFDLRQILSAYPKLVIDN